MTTPRPTGTDLLLRWLAGVSANSERPDRIAVISGTGPVGALRARIAWSTRTDDDAVRVIGLDLPPGATTDTAVLRMLLSAVGLVPVGRSGLDLRRQLVAHLQEQGGRGRRTGIILQGANLTGGQLEALRNLMNDAAGTGLWLVLVGPPALTDRIGRRRSLRGMIGVAIDAATLQRLAPINTHEVEKTSSRATTGWEVK